MGKQLFPSVNSSVKQNILSFDKFDIYLSKYHFEALSFDLLLEICLYLHKKKIVFVLLSNQKKKEVK